MKNKRVEGKLVEVKAWKVKNQTEKQKEYDINYNLNLVIDQDGEIDVYNWGGSKTDSLYRYKFGGDIGAGSELEFRYKEENYTNREGKEAVKKVIDKDSFYVLERVEPNKSGAGNAEGSFYNSKEGTHPAEIGQCLNLSVDLKIVKSYKDFADDDKVINAIKQYKFAKDRIKALWDKDGEDTLEDKEAEEHNQKLQHEGQEEVVFDDDLPF